MQQGRLLFCAISRRGTVKSDRNVEDKKVFDFDTCGRQTPYPFRGGKKLPTEHFLISNTVNGAYAPVLWGKAKKYENISRRESAQRE